MFGKPHAWGIEIGSTSLKAVYLALEGTTPTIVDWYLADYQEGEEGEAGRLAAAQTALQGFLKERKVRASDVVAVAVPGRAVFSKFIKLPPVEKKRIPEIVKYESRQQIPFPIDDVVWDFQPTQEETPPGEEIEVGIFAVRREVVQEKMGFLYQVGIRPTIIQGASLALLNCLSFGRTIDGATIVVDVGAEAADLVILQADGFWLRNLPTGGSAVTKRLQERLQISFKDAEKLKCEAAHSKQAEKLLGMMKPSVAGFVREIQMSLGFYKSQHPDIRFTKCFVTGQGFLLKGLVEAVVEGIQTPLVRLTVPEGIQTGPGIKAADFAKAADRLGVPLGLALQGLGLGKLRLNLIPPEVVRARRSAERKPYALTASLFVFLAVLFFYLKVVSVGQAALENGRQAKELLDDLTARQEEIRKVRDDPASSYKFIEGLEHKLLSEIRLNLQTGLPHDQYLRVLKEVLKILTPGEAWIEGLKIEILPHPRAAKPDFPSEAPRKIVRVTLAAYTSAKADPDATFGWIRDNIIKKVKDRSMFDCTDDCDRMVGAKVLTSQDVAEFKKSVAKKSETLTGVWGIDRSTILGTDSFRVSWLVVPGGGKPQ